MMGMLGNKAIVSVILDEKGEPQAGQDDGMEKDKEMVQAASELIKAIEMKDAKRVARAIKVICQCCEADDESSESVFKEGDY